MRLFEFRGAVSSGVVGFMRLEKRRREGKE